MIQVVAAVIKRGNRFLIARRAAHKAMPGKWEFPGGKVEAGESLEAALEREIFEEFGVRIRTGHYLTTAVHEYRDFTIELIAYYADYLEGEFSLTDHDRIAWVRKEDFPDYDLAEADLPVVHKL